MAGLAVEVFTGLCLRTAGEFNELLGEWFQCGGKKS